MSAAAERIDRMPRALRWLGVALIFIVLFLVWSGTVGPVTAAWNREADAIEQKVATVDRSRELRRQLRRLEDTVVGVGPVEMPGAEDPGRLALSDAIVGVFGDRPNDWDLSGGGDRLREDVSRGIVRPGHRLHRISGTVKFEASPEEAIRIIADLERLPAIEAVRKVTMTRDNSGKRLVNVNLVIEAWVEVQSIKRRI